MTKLWIKAAGVRALKTICQTAVALIGVSTVMQDVDWKMVASASVLAGILSILTSVGGLPEVTLEQKPDVPEGYFEDELTEESEDGDGE